MKQHDNDLGIAWRRVQDRIISSPLQWITMSGETRKRRNREWSQGETRVTCRPSRVMCQHCDSGDEISETSTVPHGKKIEHCSPSSLGVRARRSLKKGVFFAFFAFFHFSFLFLIFVHFYDQKMIFLGN